jgi:hypothetical protein
MWYLAFLLMASAVSFHIQIETKSDVSLIDFYCDCVCTTSHTLSSLIGRDFYALWAPLGTGRRALRGLLPSRFTANHVRHKLRRDDPSSNLAHHYAAHLATKIHAVDKR